MALPCFIGLQIGRSAFHPRTSPLHKLYSSLLWLKISTPAMTIIKKLDSVIAVCSIAKMASMLLSCYCQCTMAQYLAIRAIGFFFDPPVKRHQTPLRTQRQYVKAPYRMEAMHQKERQRL